MFTARFYKEENSCTTAFFLVWETDLKRSQFPLHDTFRPRIYKNWLYTMLHF